MKQWEQFEKECIEYLNDNFDKYATFQHMGGKNSNISDILVKTNKNNEFYIEVKHSPCQSGQFVLIPNFESKEFTYSNRNKIDINHFSKTIMDYMNSNFVKFSNSGTAGTIIDFENCQNCFANWIKSLYKTKNAKFIITNNFKLIDIDELEYFFDITAKYRIKKSGSSKVPKKDYENILNYILDKYPIDKYTYKNNSLFVKSNNNLQKISFEYKNFTYKFSIKENSYFEVRRLSKTRNANVIFSLRLKENTPNSLSNEQFISKALTN